MCENFFLAAIFGSFVTWVSICCFERFCNFILYDKKFKISTSDMEILLSQYNSLFKHLNYIISNCVEPLTGEAIEIELNRKTNELTLCFCLMDKEMGCEARSRLIIEVDLSLSEMLFYIIKSFRTKEIKLNQKTFDKISHKITILESTYCFINGCIDGETQKFNWVNNNGK